jgi:hypothetical protein
MLANDPPSGTKVRFVREVRKAKVASVATLKGPVSLKRTIPESADDEFRVTFLGEEMIVKRAGIEKV